MLLNRPGPKKSTCGRCVNWPISRRCEKCEILQCGGGEGARKGCRLLILPSPFLLILVSKPLYSFTISIMNCEYFYLFSFLTTYPPLPSLFFEKSIICRDLLFLTQAWSSNPARYFYYWALRNIHLNLT